MRQLTLAVSLATVMVLVVFAATVWLFDGKPFEPPIAQYQTRTSIQQDAIERFLDAEPGPALIAPAALPAAPITAPVGRRDGLPRN